MADEHEQSGPYGDLPPFEAGSDTSKEAAESMKCGAASLRRQVHAYLIRRGADGATDDEIELALKLRHQTASARRRELVLSGHVQDTGRRRRTSSGRSAAVHAVVIEAAASNGMAVAGVS